jgi:hypothetical protein
VPHRVWANPFRQARLPRGARHGLLDHRLVQATPRRRTPTRILTDTRCREHESPPPLRCRIEYFRATVNGRAIRPNPRATSTSCA